MNYLVEMKKIAKLLDDAPCTAFIAGGAVRDIDNGVVPKDIDIFCLFDGTEAERQMMLDWMQEVGFKFRRELGEGNQYEQNFNGIEGVFDYDWRALTGPEGFQWYKYYEVQLILIERNQEEADPIKQVVNKFDLGICQTAMYYLEDREKFFVSKTELYKENKLQGRLTLTPHGKQANLEDSNRIRERAARIGRKLNMLIALHFQYEIDEHLRMYQEQIAQYQQAIGQANAEYLHGQWFNAPLQPQVYRPINAFQGYQEANRLYQWRNGVR